MTSRRPSAPSTGGHVSVMWSPVAVRMTPTTPKARAHDSGSTSLGLRRSSRANNTSMIKPAPAATAMTVLYVGMVVQSIRRPVSGAACATIR